MRIEDFLKHRFPGVDKSLYIKSPEKREEEIISGLPPVVLRLFGDDIDIDGQIRAVPEKFRQKLIILTTEDTPGFKNSAELPYQLIRTKVTTPEAKKNASLLLNVAMLYGRENNLPYMFFLSSGYQRNLDMFYSMYDRLHKIHPNQDAYYFILPETHFGLSVNAHSQIDSQGDLNEFLLRGFPYETALIMKPKMQLFETELSAKGALGETIEGIPLGGIEFMLTLMNTYTDRRAKGEIHSPAMLGITLPVPLRTSPMLNDLYDYTHEVPSDYIRKQQLNPSLEVTTAQDKLNRRISTVRAAMKKLGLEDDDMRRLLSNTHITSGITNAFSLTDRKSSII